ncbi:MAG: hypothetical protein JEZ12_24090 [Desulfobacterium sp.]|nr:hypothetical protein [Desulfobacterium sp.]
MANKPIMTDPPADFPSRLAPNFYNGRMEAYLGWKKIHFPELKLMIDWMNGIDDHQIATADEVNAARQEAESLLANLQNIRASIVGVVGANGSLVSVNDETTGFISGKVVEGYGIKATVLNPGGDESLQVALGTIFEEIDIPSSTMFPRSTDGAVQLSKEFPNNKTNYDLFMFGSGTTEEAVQVSVVMPSRWDKGPIRFKFYFLNASGASVGDSVEWGARAVAISANESPDSAFGSPVFVSHTLTQAENLHITTASNPLTVGGSPASLGDIVQFEFFRNTDGADDMAEDAYLARVLIQCKLTNDTAEW